MPHAVQDSGLMPNPHFLSAPRKSPARPPPLSGRRSNASLRGSTLANVDDDDDVANGRFSLAHELAVALMPEPSAGSKLLAEEFGIEYDEGAEGIDSHAHINRSSPQFPTGGSRTPSLVDELGSALALEESNSAIESDDSARATSELDDTVSSPLPQKKRRGAQPPKQDALEILAQDLKSTDNFLAHLRKLDDCGPTGSQHSPSLERFASDVIRRIDDTVRDREGQVRELLGYERELRKIAGEVGGNDVLGHLDELKDINDLLEDGSSQSLQPNQSRNDARHTLDTVMEEEPPLSPRHLGNLSHDWETDPDRPQDDYNEDAQYSVTPTKDTFPPPPPLAGYPTPAKAIPQLAYLRSFTTSLVASLITLSEQAQVNGAATTEAGRKIRALKNKMSDWRTEWDSAEKSRVRIDRWEAGMGEKDSEITPLQPFRSISRRVDGRIIVQEHLRAFEMALADAAMKTQRIMAVS